MLCGYLQLLCAIGFYAQGSYQRPHGRMVDLNLSQASVSHAIHEVTLALNHEAVLTRYVRFPTTRAEREAVIRRLVYIPITFFCYLLNMFESFIVLPSEMLLWDFQELLGTLMVHW